VLILHAGSPTKSVRLISAALQGVRLHPMGTTTQATFPLIAAS
jgi:hypothetical protein